jgi:hypothetical protein
MEMSKTSKVVFFTITGICLCSIILSLVHLNSKKSLIKLLNRHSESKILKIDGSIFFFYPAAFVSLDEGRVIPVPERASGLNVTGDLWIEPDPEISALTSSFSGFRHSGMDSQIGLHHNTKDLDKEGSITSEVVTGKLGNISWTDRVPKHMIGCGSAFFVKSSSGRFYVVRVEGFSQEENRIAISYRELK